MYSISAAPSPCRFLRTNMCSQQSYFHRRFFFATTMVASNPAPLLMPVGDLTLHGILQQ